MALVVVAGVLNTMPLTTAAVSPLTKPLKVPVNAGFCRPNSRSASSAVSVSDAGLIVSGASPDGTLAEIMELRDHPFFVGTQVHPEFLSRPTNPHPLFRDFIGAAKQALPEGSQRELPLNGAVTAADEAVLEDRVLAVTHE